MSISKLAVVLASITLFVALAIAPSSAVQPKAKVSSGHCTNKSTWKLTLKLDAGRVEVDAELQTPKSGQRWKAVYRDNGAVFGRASKLTRADGSWSATRFASNASGADHIRVRAKNVATGEICRATGTF
jgi:hypothetical protein